MDLAPFKDFLIASVGASASFIGLLFVALSVVMGRKSEDSELEFNDRRLAESAFTAFANVFFVSLVALMPDTNIGWAALVMALIGLNNSWRLFAWAKKIKAQGGPHLEREIFWISASVIVYLLEAIYALGILIHPTSASDLNWITSIIIALFGGGLVRSWELTGIRTGKKS
jgi:hypothetical protein